MNSPSQDENTFLVVVFEARFSKAQFYEFKIVRNDTDKQYLNNWVVITSVKKLMRKTEEPFYDQVTVKPVIFKNTQTDLDKYRIYTFKKYLQRLNDPMQSNT